MPTDTSKPCRETSPLTQMVSFFIETEEYAVDILCIQEILRYQEMTRVPKAPPFIKGVINLRGKIVPVVDLRSRIGMTEAPPSEDSRVVVVKQADTVVGLTVDSMSEVLRIPESAILPPPSNSQGHLTGDYIQGVAKLEDRLLILLDLSILLDDGLR